MVSQHKLFQLNMIKKRQYIVIKFSFSLFSQCRQLSNPEVSGSKGEKSEGCEGVGRGDRRRGWGSCCIVGQLPGIQYATLGERREGQDTVKILLQVSDS